MVSIITCTIREESIDNVFKNYQQQTWPEKELIVILNKDSMDIDKWIKKAKNYPNVRVFQLHEKATLGDCLNFGVMNAGYEIIAKFDDDDYYGPEYITSSMESFKNKQVSIVGKSSYYIYFKNKKALVHVKGTENSVTDTVAGATLLFRKEIFYYVRFEKVNRAEDYWFIDQSKKEGFQVYSTDPRHFAVIRNDSDQHTWKISDEDLMGWGDLVGYTDNFESIVSKK
ncbi:family 2 glycosyl transferase [Neobacillus bataviensis LMG 21833]|uniref:Family 2 glycosyl transferase n=1 Tax=Neobacillus bataviensis LMG 21833 TaxID=1117379 RepID=K6DTI5_9BACI|nr:glycosyltransferase [Neobacillus bataviensis]EKN71689.1 family 2 glycosyl transferase [Neobacillus bataviensis LMG 21833]